MRGALHSKTRKHIPCEGLQVADNRLLRCHVEIQHDICIVVLQIGLISVDELHAT